MRLAHFIGCAAAILAANAATAQDIGGSATRIVRPIEPEQWERLNSERSAEVTDRFAKCIYDRSEAKARTLLTETDLGFRDATQIGMSSQEMPEKFGMTICLGRAGNWRGMAMRLTPGYLRAILLQQAYFERFPSQPTWIAPNLQPGVRPLPLSANDPGVAGTLAFADCVVAADPVSSDFFYRSAVNGESEKEALAALVPSLGPCLTEGQQISLTPASLRVLLGEGLWQAATNSVVVQTASSQDSR